MKMLMRGLLAAVAVAGFTATAIAADAGPQFKIDYSWPKLPLPNKWALGELGGMFIDPQDHVWIYNRPSTLFPWEKAAAMTPPTAECCIPAPPVIEFAPDGSVVQSWGGHSPDEKAKGYEWPTTEHGIVVDSKGNVWLAGSSTRDGKDGPADGQLLKFTRDGKFIMQIGHAGVSKGSTDTTQLSGAAGMALDEAANEIYVADGYGNHRVIVFDMNTGKFKRQWGAYGKTPTDDKVGQYDPTVEKPTQFRNVHCVQVAKDGLVYVCDRDNDRMQIFKKDGTFVAEHFYGKATYPPGTVGHITFWPDKTQSLLAVSDLGNFQIRIVRRDNGEVLSTFGHFGHYSGELNRLHQIAFDSKGNLYTAEAAGKRVQKFALVGGAKP
jgi:hypothetical protein